MIKLKKGRIPQILVQHAAAWTAVILGKLASGQEPSVTEKSRYRHVDIKSALIDETAGKCAYCESKLLHVTYGDVEHITPKSIEPAKTFQWENLTLACDICNTRKSDKSDVIDPYVDDPDDFFIIYGAFLLPKANVSNAVYTERVLGLNRTDLLEVREKRIKQLHDLVCLYQLEADPKTKAVIKADILSNETLASVEFAAVSRKYIADMLREGML